MDHLTLDPSHGRSFSSKVRSLVGTSVVSDRPDAADSFWLLAAFSRSRLRLNDLSVGHILFSILGGEPSLLAIVEVEEHIFKFSVASKAVGLLIYRIQSFECDQFKVFFHLWNDKGLNFAFLLDNPPWLIVVHVLIGNLLKPEDLLSLPLLLS